MPFRSDCSLASSSALILLYLARVWESFVFVLFSILCFIILFMILSAYMRRKMTGARVQGQNDGQVGGFQFQ
ncbi:hypothetical protein NEOLEDRAFT_1128582 [Neolentinus lepideus HHB14362 ss-1]|uniref:Uncharacterized protein n=1 Tax=Neolentinus lepideus HHB14362 ss-1 TaxID=1314782 RepID=A0A165V2H1_9AGAM|nr:hypothetical protein NEOLEDRAFT_1128582 [Neolentinus lepideus HHB14362 ss-1]